MSVELPPGSVPLKEASSEEVIAWVRAAIEASHEDARKVDDGPTNAELQQNGVTVDLTHKSIIELPDEAIEIMKIEIERLAISHNRLTSFPLKLAECRRLRYLNVRYNALKDVPKAILQLESLEILDLSRNRIKVLPEEIGNLTSLKVLAISRNRIERLPVRLCELNRLHLLKFDDNPIVFPPPESYSLESLQPKPTAPGELEAIVTRKIKRTLYKASKRGANSKDLDADFDPAKTPRPAPRKGSGRYPVKTSRDDIEQAITSPPDAPPVPTIPSKHQLRPDLNARGINRPQRGLTASSDAPILWSPNSSYERLAPIDYSSQLTGSTLRSDHRSHAIITPRLPPSSAKLSDSSLLMTSPDSSDGSGMTAILMGQGGNVVTQFQSNLSRSIDSTRIISLWTKAIAHGSRALLAFIKVLEYLQGSIVNMEGGEMQQLTRIDSLLKALRGALRSLGDRRSLLPIAQTPRQMNLIGRSISSTLLQVFELTGASRALPHETVAKVVTDDVLNKLSNICVAFGDNTDLASAIHTAQYQSISARVVMLKARQLLPSEFFQRLEPAQPSLGSRRQYASSVQTTNTSLSSLGTPSLNTAVSFAVRPVQSATQSPVGLSASSSVVDFPSSMSFASSPTASEPPFGAWSNRIVDPEDVRRTEVQDLQYTRLLGLLNKVIQACLSPEYSALKFLTECIQDKDQEVQANPGGPGNTPMALRMWHETAESLTKTLAMVEKVVEYLPLAQTAKEFNEMQQLQEYVRFMISFWGDFCATVSSIRRAGLWKGMPGMIPKYMQMIHVPMKEFSKYVKASPPWMHLAMDASVLPGREQVITMPNGGDMLVETPSENFPSTPLGAALGPAAAAAMGRPNAAFMSRYDQYANTSNRRY